MQLFEICFEDYTVPRYLILLYYSWPKIGETIFGRKMHGWYIGLELVEMD